MCYTFNFDDSIYTEDTLNIGRNNIILEENLENYGIVTGVADGVVKVSGLDNVSIGEKIYFQDINTGENYPGLVLNLENSAVSSVSLGSIEKIKPGFKGIRTFNMMSIKVGDFLLNRVINPIGDVLDGGLSIEEIIENLSETEYEDCLLETPAPSIISRSPVRESVETGIKVIDALVPIGHGQRELIIGDSKTGKSSIAIDTVLNQKGKDVICIYVVIGQKRSFVSRLIRILKDRDCLKHTVIVAATASDSAALQYLAPYAGCAIGEYFMKKGLKTICVYDDLSKHAVAYRQLSLLLRRPPGREGYPGDVFFLHSRLLERAANLKNGGSLTALPIIETIQGDVSSYIPTNVISITDGQIFLDTELFNRGIRPAVSPGLSVSRVGSAAQNKVIKRLSGSLKLELAQFREVEDFTRLGFVLDDITKRLVDRGQKLTELLIQQSNNPIDINDQTILLYAALKGYLIDIPSNLISIYEIELFDFMKQNFCEKPLSILLSEELDNEVLNHLLKVFTDNFKYIYGI